MDPLPVPETLTIEFPRSLDAAIERVLQTACDRDLQLATAESCTGGLLASVLTDVTGCSHAFDSGFVVYTDAAKHALLGVPEDMLDEHGAVSRPVAIAMAEGALARSRADIALAVTGFAGPAGDMEEGLVHFACLRRGRDPVHREAHYGAIGRGPTRVECLKTAINMIGDALE